MFNYHLITVVFMLKDTVNYNVMSKVFTGGVFMTFVLALVSLATANWVNNKDDKTSYGLWQYCIKGACSKLEIRSSKS